LIKKKFDSVLKYMLGVYTMNGTFIGWKPLEAGLSYCTNGAPYTSHGGGESAATDWQIVGYSRDYSFRCELQPLLQREQLFYELFLYGQNANNAYYVPVPVRITNIAENGVSPNAQYPKVPLCDSSDVLVRRFFLFDVVSAITSINSDNTAATPTTIRYASFISIEASQVINTPSRIYPPVLTITYTEVSTSTITVRSVVDVQLSTAYTSDPSAFRTTFYSLFITIMVFTGLLFAVRYRNWNARNARVLSADTITTELGGFNISTIRELLLIAMNTWVLMFLPFTIMYAWYFFVYIKIQYLLTVMLPPDRDYYSKGSPYYVFYANMHVMFFLQLTYVLVMIYRQCKADLFFIDWEPSKVTADGKQSRQGGVSVWRTILVANEWTELQTIRKTDIRFTLMFLALILLGQGLDYNATLQPDLDNKSPGPLNVILRFANTTFFWLILSYGQYLWRFMIAERYLGEPPERLFVDFCTIAKISVIVLDEKYHGYYLHCRSPHQYADGTMTELVEMLHKEEAGLTTDRSLDGAPPEVQTFQIFVSGEWRTSFDKIKDAMVGADNMTVMMNEGRNRAMERGAMAGAVRGGITRGAHTGAASTPPSFGSSSGGGSSTGNSIPSERVMRAWKEMLVFLQEFIENNFGKTSLRRLIREPTYVEKLTCAAPDITAADQPSVFFTDREFDYCKVWFLGRERELLMLNICAYSLFDLWFNSTGTSIALTYLLEQGLVYLRHSWGQAALAKKTLIDSRFLI